MSIPIISVPPRLRFVTVTSFADRLSTPASSDASRGVLANLDSLQIAAQSILEFTDGNLWHSNLMHLNEVTNQIH